MEEIFSSLMVVEDILVALIHREGLLGKLLNMVEAIENGEFALVEELMEEIPNLSRAKINVYVAQALAWSNQLAVEI